MLFEPLVIVLPGNPRGVFSSRNGMDTGGGGGKTPPAAFSFLSHTRHDTKSTTDETK